MPPAGFDLGFSRMGPRRTRHGDRVLWVSGDTRLFLRAWADAGWRRTLDRCGYQLSDGPLGREVLYWEDLDPKAEANRAREVRRIDAEARVMAPTRGAW